MTWKPQYTWIVGLLIIAGAFLAFQAIRPSRHYKLSDFDSKDAPGSGKNMQRKFLNKLDRMIDEVGTPLNINSGFRTPERNAAVGGANDSAHLRGWAADLSFGNQNRERVIAIAKKHFKRIGIGQTFIHVDADPSLTSPATWYYS